MNNNILYISKQLAKEGTEKYIGFSCPSKKERAFKNDCFNKVCAALNELGVKTASVDFDKDGQSAVKAISTEDIANENADVVLINLPYVSGNEHLYVTNDKLKNIILSVCYGKTSYSNFEKAVDVFNENGITLKAVISKKRRFAVSGLAKNK